MAKYIKKFNTDEEVPEGAVYLYTESYSYGVGVGQTMSVVRHYFLVEEK